MNPYESPEEDRPRTWLWAGTSGEESGPWKCSVYVAALAFLLAFCFASFAVGLIVKD